MDKLISSEKLIHDLSGIRDTLPDIFLKNVMSAAISCVEKQPAAVSEWDADSNVPGEWIEASDVYPKLNPGDYHICPRCNLMVSTPKELARLYFCPKCGKRMYRRNDDGRKAVD